MLREVSWFRQHWMDWDDASGQLCRGVAPRKPQEVGKIHGFLLFGLAVQMSTVPVITSNTVFFKASNGRPKQTSACARPALKHLMACPACKPSRCDRGKQCLSHMWRQTTRHGAFFDVLETLRGRLVRFIWREEMLRHCMRVMHSACSRSYRKNPPHLNDSMLPRAATMKTCHFSAW